MSPACGCQQRFGSSDCSVRATADSWPHSGLAEILSITDVTPHTSQLRYDMVCFGDKRHLGDAEVPVVVGCSDDVSRESRSRDPRAFAAMRSLS